MPGFGASDAGGAIGVSITGRLGVGIAAIGCMV